MFRHQCIKASTTASMFDLFHTRRVPLIHTWAPGRGLIPYGEEWKHNQRQKIEYITFGKSWLGRTCICCNIILDISYIVTPTRWIPCYFEWFSIFNYNLWTITLMTIHDIQVRHAECFIVHWLIVEGLPLSLQPIGLAPARHFRLRKSTNGC